MKTFSSEPVKDRARRGVPYLPLGLLAGLGAILAYVWKRECRFGGAWNGGIGQYEHFCYTDIYPLWWAERLNEGQVPYFDYPVEYPVGIGAVMEFVRRLVSGMSDPALAFYDITVLLMGICLVIGVLVMAALAGPERRWDAVWYALAPAVILTAFINWDLLCGVLVLGALLAWSRRRHGWAGVLLALAISTKFYPVMFLGPLFLLALRTGKWREFGTAFLTAVGTWLLVNVPVAVLAFDGWKKFYVFSEERPADWGSLWYFFQVKGWPVLGDGEHLDRLGIASLALLCLGIAVLALLAPTRPRLMQLCFLALASFMLTNKVWSPQFVLWLVPFAVLARPRWPALVPWQAAEVWYFFAIWLYLINFVPGFEGQGIHENLYFTGTWGRAITIVIMMALVVYDILRPERDVVRRGGVDDPSGGVFDRAEDRFTLRTIGQVVARTRDRLRRTAEPSEPAESAEQAVPAGKSERTGKSGKSEKAGQGAKADAGADGPGTPAGKSADRPAGRTGAPAGEPAARPAT